MTLDEVVLHFQHVSKNGAGYVADCPVCGDTKQHLYINNGKSGVVMTCQHDGCNVDDILASVGLTTKDLFNTQIVATPRRTHVYHNQDGTEYARKDIYPKEGGGKGAFWYRLTNGEKVKGRPKDTVCPLYNAHILANDKNDYILVVEGEKDVDTLNRMGIVSATTYPDGGGAKAKWHDEYNTFFAGKRIYILTDNDEAGRKYGDFIHTHVAHVGTHTAIIPATAIYPEAGKKWDISDIADKLGEVKTKVALFEAAKRTASTSTASEVTTATSDEKKQPRARLTIEYLADYADANGITLRHNIITNGVEASAPDKNGDVAPADFEMLTIRLHSILHGDLNVVGATQETIRDYARVIARSNRYNPVLDVITAEAWDGVDRFGDVFKMLGIEGDDLSKTLVHKWFWQGIALLHNDDNNPFGADGVLVLSGKQGIGKTSYFAHFAIRPEWFGMGRTIDDRDKDTIRRIVTRWIVELGEIGTTFKHDVDYVKAFITTAFDEYRLPYAKDDTQNARHVNMGASVNGIDGNRYLIDPTGNRRFWTVFVDRRIDTKHELMAIDPLAVWRQAYAEVMAKGDLQCFRLTPEEIELLDIRNRGVMKYEKGEVEVLDILARADADNWPIHSATVTEWTSKNCELRKYTAQQIGRMLQKHGYKAKVTNKGRFYDLPFWSTENAKDW